MTYPKTPATGSHANEADSPLGAVCPALLDSSPPSPPELQPITIEPVTRPRVTTTILNEVNRRLGAGIVLVRRLKSCRACDIAVDFSFSRMLARENLLQTVSCKGLPATYMPKKEYICDLICQRLRTGRWQRSHVPSRSVKGRPCNRPLLFEEPCKYRKQIL